MHSASDHTAPCRFATLTTHTHAYTLLPAGRYFGKPSDAAAALPFDAGFESVGVVAAVGEGVSGLAPGSCVATMSPGFSEYGITAAKHVMPVPTATPEMVALLTSGLTASIGVQRRVVHGAAGSGLRHGCAACVRMY
jgi:NADPH:quinone reductase-like Zn-dependent oxidoreductase